MEKFTASCKRCGISRGFQYIESSEHKSFVSARESMRSEGWYCAGTKAVILCEKCWGIVARSYFRYKRKVDK